MANSIELAIRIAGRVDQSLNKSVKQSSSVLGKLQKIANKVSSGIAGAAAGATALAVGTVATTVGIAAKAAKDMIDLGNEWQQATNQVSAATGTTGTELEHLRDIMEGIYANNFGESVEDVADALAQVKTNMRELPTDQLQTATEAAIALRDAFDYDVASTTRAADAMRKNFGTAAEDAFGLIAAGAQNGLNFSDEFLDNLNEYSVHFKKLGFDADGMFQVFQSGADSPAWALDKVGDAVKEFSIKAIDGSDSTIAAFEALGYNAKETMSIFANGGDAANNAFFDVLDSLMTVEDAVKRDALGVSLFGTMWEDLGVEAMTALSQASDAAYDTGNALEQINRVKYNDLDSVLGGLKRKLEVALLPAADAMYQALLEQAPALESMIDNLAPKLAELAGSFSTKAIELVIDSLPSITQAIGDFANKAIEKIPVVVQHVREFAAAAREKLPEVLQYLQEFGAGAKEVLGQVKPYLAAMWEHKDVVAKVAIALGLLGPAITVLSGVFKVFGGVIKGVSLTIKAFKAVKTYTALFSAWTKATTLLTAAKIKDKAETIALQAMYAKDALIKAKDTAVTAANTVATKASTLARKAAGGVNMAAAFLANSAAKVKDTAATAANTVATKASTLAQKAAGGVHIAAAFLASSAAKIKDTAVTVAHTTAMVASTAAQKAAAVASYALGTAIKFMTGPIGIIITAIAALVAAGIALYKNWDTVRAKLENFGAMVGAIWANISSVIENGIAAIGAKFPALGAYLTGWWQSIKAAVENIKNIFSGIIDFISNVFSGNWSAAWQNIVDIFSNIFGMIGNLVKAPINAVISVINYAIEKINGISVTIPDWAPGGLGGKTLGFNIPTIPQLAAGGIATRATLAEIGEGGEPEAVLPLSKLSQLLKQVTGLDLNGSGGGNPGGGEPQVIQFAPVFNFYGPVSREQAEEAGRCSFAEFMKLYKRMQAEERRKKFAPT